MINHERGCNRHRVACDCDGRWDLATPCGLGKTVMGSPSQAFPMVTAITDGS